MIMYECIRLGDLMAIEREREGDAYYYKIDIE